MLLRYAILYLSELCVPIRIGILGILCGKKINRKERKVRRKGEPRLEFIYIDIYFDFTFSLMLG